MRWIVLSMMLMGCGKDFCDRTADMAEDCDDEVDDADMETCREAIKDCSSDDEKALDKYMDCMIDAGLFDCDTETITDIDEMEATLEAMFACTTPLMTLSEECLQAAGGGFTTTTTPTQ